jgi:hypothetical protein
MPPGEKSPGGSFRLTFTRFRSSKGYKTMNDIVPFLKMIRLHIRNAKQSLHYENAEQIRKGNIVVDLSTALNDLENADTFLSDRIQCGGKCPE